MKTKLFSTIVAIALILFLGSCANDEIAQNGQGTIDAPIEEVTFEAVPAAPTRTTMSSTGVFKWQAGDKIWVKDDDGAWKQSSNAPTTETAAFKFKVPGKFTAGGSYTVYYPGKNGSQDQVSIAASQAQQEPNVPEKVGEKGDCGWATATAVAGKKQFNFTLDHKAAFLVFSPYCTNTVLNSSDVKLTKIEVSADNNIVGTFTLNTATNQLTGAGAGKQVNLTTTGGSATPNGFEIPTSATPAKNASYVVIKPGHHTLRVRFWLKDYVTNIQGTCTKEYPAFTYNANTYYTMNSELKIKNYTTPYYMWDAEKPYWKGHEWDKGPSYVAGVDQSTVNYTTGSAYPQSSTDPFHRWYNDANYTTAADNYARQPHFANVPNANEMSWHVMKGDPRWDNDELWTTMGHLYKGGMWFKKMNKIIADNTTVIDYVKAVAGVSTREEAVKARGIVSAGTYDDYRTTFHNNISSTPTNLSTNPIPVADAGNYFYLPALGFYLSGSLRFVGNYGSYWLSSANPSDSNYAYNFLFLSNIVVASHSYRYYGLSVAAFE